jgi:prolyl-tRNA synthetase
MALTPRDKDFSARYNELVEQAWLAQSSAVRGCMVIKPYGFAIRENMQKYLYAMFKATWHQNAYFPLFIPKSFFTKEAKHVEWFATEAAVVTHYRLKKNDSTGTMEVDPEAKLEEELIVRPTSETIIWNTYKDRVQSYRDLPILVNQRANVVRREMRTRLFLRTAEFLWQEWHTAHASKEEALEETKKMRDVYQDFFSNFLAISGVPGEKSENERFAGAENTYTIECMMQDGKALQACTSHFLGQNFGKAFDVSFVNKDNTREHAWATSRWASTRMMWWLIMSHSDDKGLVLPPAIAPYHVVIIPLFKNSDEWGEILQYINKIQPYKHGSIKRWLFQWQRDWKIYVNDQFNIHLWHSKYIKWEYNTSISTPLKFKLDDDDSKTPGWKYSNYEMMWVPLRIVIGKRDMEKWQVELYRRDTQEKQFIKIEDISKEIEKTLHDMQNSLFQKTKTMREANTIEVNTYDEFKKALEDGKFVMAHRDGTPETEEAIKQETKATIRCIPRVPADIQQENGSCIKTGKPSPQRVLFAIAY